MVRACIWVEGTSDQKFLADMMKVWFNLTFHSKDFKYFDADKKIDIKIQDLGGKNTFLTEKISSLFKQNYVDETKNIVIIDADEIAEQRQMLERIKQELNMDFPFFLLPDNHNNGELENLLEQIINPENQVIFDCWNNYESCVSQYDNPTRLGLKYTIPAKKSKIYSYLEVLLGDTDNEKELAKDKNRDFTNTAHWIIDGNKKPLKPLKIFLEKHLNFF